MSLSEEVHPVDPLADVAHETAQLRYLAREILQLEEGRCLPQQAIQRGLSSLSKLYAVNYQMGERSSPFTDDRGVPPTVVMILATAMLRAVDVELFELGMWQAWAGS